MHLQASQRRGEVAAEKARLEEASLPLMLDAMWAANLIDIQSTVRHVCRMVRALHTAADRWTNGVFLCVQ